MDPSLLVAVPTACVVSDPTAPHTGSPTRHPFMRRVEASRFVFDPYKGARGAPCTAVARSPTRCGHSQPCCKGVDSPQCSAKSPLRGAPTKRIVSVPSSVPRYAVVAFKKTAGVYRAPFKIAVGDVVVIEGDRGEHMGTVTQITTSPAEIPTEKILRRASEADQTAFSQKVEKEAAALTDIERIAKEVRLSATVVDVEYQLDLHKLTIFVDRAESSSFVDFRKLQRTVHRQFQCRIWCIYVDEIIDGVVTAKQSTRKPSEPSSGGSSSAGETEAFLAQ